MRTRPARRDDLRAVVELFCAYDVAFRGGVDALTDPAAHDRTFETWCGFLLETDRFDPSLYLVAEADGQVVGAALSQLMGPDYGFVRQLAVAPSRRGQGLGLTLLHECFRRHAVRDLPATVLGVDAANLTGALDLYAEAGMRVHEQFTRWDRPG